MYYSRTARESGDTSEIRVRREGEIMTIALVVAGGMAEMICIMKEGVRA